MEKKKIDLLQQIVVLNDSNSNFHATTNYYENGIVFPQRDEDTEMPSETTIAYRDLKEINSKSSFFKDGLLRIESDYEEDVLADLRIKLNAKNFLSREEIIDILLNPTAEKLEKIIKIESAVTIEKVKNILIELNNSDDYYIAIEVFKTIDRRYAEIFHGKRRTEIVIKQKKNEVEEKPKKATSKKKTKEE